MAGKKGFRDLLAWQKAMDLVTAVYLATQVFPRHEQFGLITQARRAAISIPANIAEGQARRHRREFRQFLGVALGSLAELETHLELAHRLGYLKEAQAIPLLQQADEVAKILHGLLRALPASNS